MFKNAMPVETFVIQPPTAGYEGIPDTDVKHLNMLPREGDENLPC